MTKPAPATEGPFFDARLAVDRPRLQLACKKLKPPADGVYRFIGTTPTRDRDGDEIPVKGWDFKAFRDNPRLLWSHNYMVPPIGKVTKIKKEEVDGVEGIVFDVVFASTPFAQEIRQLVDEDMLSAVSVGFRPTKSRWIEEEEGEREIRHDEFPDTRLGKVFLKKELLELSIVNVPANPGALRVKALAGQPMPYELYQTLGVEPTQTSIYLGPEGSASMQLKTTDAGVRVAGFHGMTFEGDGAADELARRIDEFLGAFDVQTIKEALGYDYAPFIAPPPKRLAVLDPGIDDFTASCKRARDALFAGFTRTIGSLPGGPPAARQRGEVADTDDEGEGAPKPPTAPARPPRKIADTGGKLRRKAPRRPRRIGRILRALLQKKGPRK